MKRKGNLVTIIIIYVEVVVNGNDMVEIASFKKYLDEEFETKELGESRYFWGIEASRSRNCDLPMKVHVGFT